MGVANVVAVERNLRQGCRNGPKNASFEVREASRARAPDSPSPGEGRVSRMPANATTGRSGRTVSGAGERSAADERPGQMENGLDRENDVAT